MKARYGKKSKVREKAVKTEDGQRRSNFHIIKVPKEEKTMRQKHNIQNYNTLKISGH